MLETKHRDCVELMAFDTQGKLIHSEVIPTYEWYENNHAIIDSDDYRKRAEVRYIDGRQYDMDGNLSQSWRGRYAETGELKESWHWFADGTSKHNLSGGPTA